jgi:hypothetical protein
MWDHAAGFAARGGVGMIHPDQQLRSPALARERRLREGLFHLELQLLQDMVTGGIDISRVTALSHCAHAIEVVDVLKITARER